VSSSGERSATRTVLSIVSPGAEAVAAERRDSEHGAAKEAAALGALRLLRLGFERDEDVVRALRRAESGGPGLCVTGRVCF
jgi:hypothetical protein